MIIYVAGYPKSGTTWMTRLVGDVLQYRTGGSLLKEDEREIATEGLNRSLDHVVRKGHFILSDHPAANPVTRAHQMSWKGISKEKHKVIFVVRDPRDIVVSGAHHWSLPIASTLQNMIRGTNNFRFVGSWQVYIRSWLDRYQKFGAVIVQYEAMLKSAECLAAILEELDREVAENEIHAAYERQSFKNRLKDVKQNGHKYNLGKSFNLKFMRKGVAGDWRNHFSRAEAFEAESVFGDLLRFFNYESDPHWWKEII